MKVFDLEKLCDVMTSGEPDYPALLKEIKNFPKNLFYIGDKSILKEQCISMVGSRRTTQSGRAIATSMAARLAERGRVIVSGMALGIDTCVHNGALKVGGKTIAVLGCGPDICYPTSNWNLKNNIMEKGLILSEYPPRTQPEKYFFPQRNRIISGLSEATIVVQAGNNSGALITAELAAEQGRNVFAVPGNIDSTFNFGSNKLIKEGAIPIISTESILEELGIGPLNRSEAENILSETELEIYELLDGHGEMTIDEICICMECSPEYVSSIITIMEMKGAVFSALGKIFIAKG
jgi:DNA processing protein